MIHINYPNGQKPKDRCDLRLMSSVNGVSGIPTAGNRLIIVAAVDQVLHFRIFDGGGKMVVDTDANRLTEQARPIENLREQLKGLWPPRELTEGEKDRVIAAVTSIVGHTPKDDWPNRAKALTDLLKAAPDKTARDKIIDDNSHLWGEIKDWLGKFSHGKCWFSEARDTCSYWHVEHFRPKKEAKDPDRDGYWWLAFDFSNYRLCGGVINVKKGAYFPLKPESRAATSSQDNHADEAYVLIDPIRKDDVDLITFSCGGFAMPSEAAGWRWERADKSIKRYKLNDYPPLRRAREAVWNNCDIRVNELQEQIELRKEAETAGKHSPARNERIEQLKRDLREMTLPSAQFSAVARAYLLQDLRQWVRNCIA